LIAALCTALLAGCNPLICDLLGNHVGTFEGDLEGPLMVDLTEDPTEGLPLLEASFNLSNDDFEAAGAAIIDCRDGIVSTDLAFPGGELAGEVEGVIDELGGTGEWLLDSGESGTWAFEIPEP